MKRLWLWVLLIAVGLMLGACVGDRPTEDDGVTPSAEPTAASTPTPAPTEVPPTPTAPRPTATWVPLITPSPTPEGGAFGRSDVPRIGVAEAKARAEAGEALLIDVRAEGTYNRLHIAGAISMPIDQVDERYKELPAGTLLVFY